MRIKIYNAKNNKIENVEKIIRSDKDWEEILSPEQFKVLRKKGTEAAFSKTCPIPDPNMKVGLYRCAACGSDLFIYETKFDSSTGWPSFNEPVSDLNVKIMEDSRLGIKRNEVICARCDSHLGHVFNDGPPPTKKRYCINTIALKLFKDF